MDIPDWSLWLFLGLALLQVLTLVPISRRLREPDPAVRSEARLDLLDTFAGLLLFGGALMSVAVADSWLWLLFVGFALMTVVYAVKGVRYLRALRSPSAGS
ncbi:hypothetical protein ACIRG4_18330 [Streptomyces sp. NPDC102395]|uniref:hypothetical protein n=1 Tax=Streptomyces sp. NPDC102395 TaxID=3366168 RepID=UPI003828828E